MSIQKRIALLVALFHSARLTTGAIHAFFLLHSGVSLSQIAVLQIFYSATCLLLEYPTGAVADFWSKKWSVVLGCFISSLFFPLCLFAPNMKILIFAEILYALGMCLNSGSMEAWLVQASKDPKSKNEALYLKSELQNLGMMFFAPVGALIVYLFPSSGFVVSFTIPGVILFLLAISFSMLPSDRKNETSAHSFSATQYFHTLRSGVRNGLGSSKGRFFVLIGTLIVCAFQPIFHFWQPMLIKAAGLSTTSDSTANQVIILGLGFLFVSLSRYTVVRFLRKKYLDKVDGARLGMAASILASASLFVLIATSEMGLSVFASIVFLAFSNSLLSFSEVSNDALYLSRADHDTLSSVYSLKGTTERIFAILFLSVAASYPNLTLLFFISMAVVLIISISFFLIHKKALYESIQN